MLKKAANIHNPVFEALYIIQKESLMEWLIENKTWLFSGAAIAIPLAIIGWLFSRKSNKQIQKSGNNSTNIQIGGNIKVNTRKDDE